MSKKGFTAQVFETNRKFKLTVGLIVLVVFLFVVPETTSSFYNLNAEHEAAALIIEEGEERPVPIKLAWHLLNAATFATLLGTLITVYLGANIAQKVWVEPPRVLGKPTRTPKPSSRRYPGELPEAE